MKIGFVSDTHKNIKNLDAAVEFLKILGAKQFIHLGDDYTDFDEIGEEHVIRVPGVYSDAYRNPDVPNRRTEIIEGWRFLLTHTTDVHENDLPGDMNPGEEVKEGRIDVVLYGHTHIPDVKKVFHIIYINPGHLKEEDKRGYPPTFGFLDVTPGELLVRIFRLGNYTVFTQETFTRKEL
jgi:putative phosphoesterase